MKLWGLEPAMIIGLITATISLLTTFGIKISNDQQLSIENFVSVLIIILGAWFVRQQVTPNAKVVSVHGTDGLAAAQAVTKTDLAQPPTATGTGSGRPL